jgi:hypothetical protein
MPALRATAPPNIHFLPQFAPAGKRSISLRSAERECHRIDVARIEPMALPEIKVTRGRHLQQAAIRRNSRLSLSLRLAQANAVDCLAR